MMVRLQLTLCLSAKSFALMYSHHFTDIATIGWASSYVVAEGDSQSVCVSVQAGTLGRDVTFTVTSSDGTATSTGGSRELRVHW